MKECPWCKSTDIKYSLTTSASQFKRSYHACFYCWDCNCYGPSVIYKPEKDEHRHTVASNEMLKQRAAEKWDFALKNFKIC